MRCPSKQDETGKLDDDFLSCEEPMAHTISFPAEKRCVIGKAEALNMPAL
jgi:hypothetical protein